MAFNPAAANRGSRNVFFIGVGGFLIGILVTLNFVLFFKAPGNAPNKHPSMAVDNNFVRELDKSAADGARDFVKDLKVDDDAVENPNPNPTTTSIINRAIKSGLAHAPPDIKYANVRGYMASPPVPVNPLYLPNSYICAKGDPGWTAKEMGDHFIQFERDVFSVGGAMTKENEGGMGLFKASFLSYVIHKLQPRHIIESGAFNGKGTWIIDQVKPAGAQTIVITPETPSAYLSKFPNSVNFVGPKFKDFNEIDWDSLGINKRRTLVYFDDHMHSERRLREAKARGFIHFVFDDNGLAYDSPKAQCDAKYKEIYHHVNSAAFVKPEELSIVTGKYVYADNFHHTKKWLSSAEMDAMYDEFVETVDVYFEAAPIWDWEGPSRHNVMTTYLNKMPLFPKGSAEEQMYIKKYGLQTAQAYNYQVYVKLKSDDSS